MATLSDPFGLGTTTGAAPVAQTQPTEQDPFGLSESGGVASGSTFKRVLNAGADALANMAGSVFTPIPVLSSYAGKAMRGLGQAITRDIGGIGLSLTRPFREQTIAGADTLAPQDVAGPGPLQDIWSAYFGEEPMTELSSRVASFEESIKKSPFAKRLGLDQQALPLAFAGVVGGEGLNFLGLGGEAAAGKALLERVKTLPELFQFSRRFEQMGPGGAVPEKVAGILKSLDVNRLAQNPVELGVFDKPFAYALPSGKSVSIEANTPYVISGHNRLEILKQGGDQLPSDVSGFFTTKTYPGTQEGVAQAIRDSIMTNVKNQSIKDIEILDNAINGTLERGAIAEALDYNTQKAKYLSSIVDSFRNNDLVGFWNGSVAPKLAALKNLDWGALTERLNFVQRIAQKTADAVKSMPEEQAVAVKNQVAEKISEFMATSKQATLASVEKNIGRVLDTIQNGGFKNTDMTNLFGETVTQTVVQKKVPVQALEAAIADTLKNPLVPEETRANVQYYQKLMEHRDSPLVAYVNEQGGLTKNAAKTKALLDLFAKKTPEEIVQVVASDAQKAAAANLARSAAGYQPEYEQAMRDIAQETGLTVHLGPVKTSDRIIEKAILENKGDVAATRDANRSTVMVDSTADAEKLIASIEQRYTVTRIKPKFDEPAGSYRSAIVNVQTPYGEAEIAMTTPEMWAARNEEGAGAIFSKIRKMPPATAEYARMEAEMKATYGRASEAFASRTRGSDAGISVPSRNTLSSGNGKPAATPVANTLPSMDSSRTTVSLSPTTKNRGYAGESAIPGKDTIPQGGAQGAQGGAVDSTTAAREAAYEEGLARSRNPVSQALGVDPASIAQPLSKEQLSAMQIAQTPDEVAAVLRQAGWSEDIIKRFAPEMTGMYGKELEDAVQTIRSVDATQKMSEAATAMQTLQKTPSDAVLELAQQPDGKSWTSLVRGFMAKAKPGARAHAIDYLATPEYVLEKLGLAKPAELLHDARDAYLTTVKKEFATISAWQKRVAKDPYSERLIFQYLDGQEKEVYSSMTNEQIAVAQEIRAYLKQWADRLGLPEDKQISRYITHIFERQQGKIFENMFEDPELAAIMSERVAGSVYDPFLQRRLGGQEYIQDVWRALDAYVKRGARKEAMDPALQALDDAAKNLDDLSYNYVTKLSHRVNMRPTEIEKAMDSFITQTPLGYYFTERPVAYLTKAIRGMFYRGTLGLNFSSALRNLSQGANTYAKLGEKYTVVGYAKMLGRLASRNLGELYDQNVLMDAFIQDTPTGVIRKRVQQLDKGLFVLFDLAEKINRGSAYFGAKSKGLAQGLPEAEAIKYAKRMVRETQFAFGAVDTPVALNDDIIKTLTQLQTYNIKQVEFLARMVKNKEFAGLIRYSAAALTFVYIIGRLFGMTPAQLIPTIGFGGAPMTSTVSAAARSFSSNEQDAQQAQNQLNRNVLTLFPAGAQIKKTIEGAQAYAKGKDTTPTGRFRFRVDQDTATLMRVLLFGKYSLPQAREYFDSLGKKKTAPVNGTGPFGI